MMRITLLACLIALLSKASAAADDEWAWEDLTEVHVIRSNAADEDESAQDDSPQEPVSVNANGEALNFGAYFGNGDEFVGSNVSYKKELFITITDVDVDAHSGRLDDLAYIDDGSAAVLPESDVVVENNSAERPDNVFGPLYGVPENAVGLGEYRSEDYGGMAPGDEDVVEEVVEPLDEEGTVEAESFTGTLPADDGDEAESDEAAEDAATGEESSEDESDEEEVEDEEQAEEEEQRQNPRREKRKPEEWWNEG